MTTVDRPAEKPGGVVQPGTDRSEGLVAGTEKSESENPGTEPPGTAQPESAPPGTERPESTQSENELGVTGKARTAVRKQSVLGLLRQLSVWALLLAIALAYLALLVHRGRTGGVPWGIGLAWLLVAAGGIQIRAGRNLAAGIQYAVVVISIPPIVQAISESGGQLLINDARTLVWYLGSIVVVTLTAFWGARTAARTEDTKLPPYDDGSR